MQNFQVTCKAEASLETFAAYVYMDGIYMNGVVIYPKQAGIGHAIRGCPVSAAELKLFAFAKVSLTGERSLHRGFYSIRIRLVFNIDDETVAAINQQHENLGTIEVKFHRVEVTGYSKVFYNERNEHNLSGNSVIHERSKKMGMHHVAYVVHFHLYKR